MKRPRSIAAICAAVLFVVCVASPVFAAAKPTEQIKIMQRAIVDPQSRMRAMVVAVPGAWQFSGQVAWDGQSIACPARVKFKASGAADGAEFVYAPSMLFHFLTQPPARIDRGAMYAGMPFSPPVSASEVVRDAFKSIRPQASNVKITGTTKPKWMTDFCEQTIAQARSRAAARGEKAKIEYDVAEVSFEYTEGGKVYEEKMLTNTAYMAAPLKAGGTYIFWGCDPIFCKRTLKGRYAEHADEFALIEKNCRVDPKWKAAVEAVGRSLIQQQIGSLKQAGDIGKRMAQQAGQVRDEQVKHYSERQDSYDRVSRARSDATLGNERYGTPDGTLILPSGYDRVWRSGNGEIVMDNNPNFNPNSGGGTNWSELKKADY